MNLIGGIICFLVLLFISTIDLVELNKKEIINISIKKFNIANFLLNFLIIFCVNLYIIILFFDYNVLYIINLLCFLCLYICAITDIFCRNIFLKIIIIFLIPIMFLNFYGNYFKMSLLGFVSGMILYGIIYIISFLIYNMESFGIGDIYVISFVGFSTDWYTVIYIGLFTFVIAGVFYFIKFLFEKDFKNFKNKEIPLVPFILLSYLILIYF